LLNRAASKWLGIAAGAIGSRGNRARAKLLRVAGDRLPIAPLLSCDRAGAKRPRLTARAVGPPGDCAGTKFLRVTGNYLTVAASLSGNAAAAKRLGSAAGAIRAIGDRAGPERMGVTSTRASHAGARWRGLSGQGQRKPTRPADEEGNC